MTIRSSPSSQRAWRRMDWSDTANVISEYRPPQILESGRALNARFRRTLMVVHLALLFRNVACGRMKFRGAPVIAPSMNKSSPYFPPAKCYQKNKGLVSTSTVAGGGRYPARGGDGGALAAGTVVRGAVKVRSVILKRLVRQDI
jgi:hypothetical protein